ncbi:MAG: hypothetical protein WCJ30_20060 [Deltaproteobacteria bacterium]
MRFRWLTIAPLVAGAGIWLAARRAPTAQVLPRVSAPRVIVLEGDACNPSACLAYGLGSALFEATAGQTYQVVVDGYGVDIPGAAGDFTLTVTCE